MVSYEIGMLPATVRVVVDQCGTVPLDADLDQVCEHYASSAAAIVHSSYDEVAETASSSDSVSTKEPMTTFFLDHTVRPTAKIWEAVADPSAKYAPIRGGTFEILRCDICFNSLLVHLWPLLTQAKS